MIFLWMLALAVLLMAPLAFAFTGRTVPRARRDAALALHRAQLEELQRDLAEARIPATSYAAAKLEIERRLLTADAITDSITDAPANSAPSNASPASASPASAKLLLAATLIAIPIMAFALYLPGSTPTVPSEPHTRWLAQQQADQQRFTGIISALRAHLAGVDPASVYASQGQAYLAEALAEQAGQITPEALALFNQSLAHAPPTASWRSLDERRLAEAAGE